jgi:hypothetical protein
MTTDDLISYPLPKRLPVECAERPNTSVIDRAARRKAQGVPDYHIAVALLWGDYEYAEAVSELAKSFKTMNEAFSTLSSAAPSINISDEHLVSSFAARFNNYCERIT